MFNNFIFHFFHFSSFQMSLSITLKSLLQFSLRILSVFHSSFPNIPFLYPLPISFFLVFLQPHHYSMIHDNSKSARDKFMSWSDYVEHCTDQWVLTVQTDKNTTHGGCFNPAFSFFAMMLGKNCYSQPSIEGTRNIRNYHI